MRSEIELLLKDSDIFIYFGLITMDGHERLTDVIESIAGRKNTAYILPVTVGGDPNAGFRIARALGHYYPEGVKCFVPDLCKSAGTLMAIGCKELIISNKGELGPLDIQIPNKDKLFENSSGLDIIRAIAAIQDTVQFSFNRYLIDLTQAGLGTRLAAKIASGMATGSVAPIAAQIDPLKLGQHQRKLQIATEYGVELNRKFTNIDPGNIEKLTSKYPSHDFVIDRKIASTLFKRVRDTCCEENTLEKSIRLALGNLKAHADRNPPLVINLALELDSLIDLSTPLANPGGTCDGNNRSVENDSAANEAANEAAN